MKAREQIKELQKKELEVHQKGESSQDEILTAALGPGVGRTSMVLPWTQTVSPLREMTQ